MKCSPLSLFPSVSFPPHPPHPLLLILFRKEQASNGSQPIMTYQVAVRLGINKVHPGYTSLPVLFFYHL